MEKVEGLVDPSGRPEFFISCERVIYRKCRGSLTGVPV